jgi:hypothetical protein
MSEVKQNCDLTDEMVGRRLPRLEEDLECCLFHLEPVNPLNRDTWHMARWLGFLSFF